jgi:hypothetical protein
MICSAKAAQYWDGTFMHDWTNMAVQQALD